MRLNNILQVVDAHAEGEASRIVVGGVTDVPGETMFEKRLYLERERDSLRQFLLFEPRGGVALSADVVLPSSHPEADFGFVILESTDYPAMSGTNCLCTATVMLEMGIQPMVEPVTRFNLEAPAGIVAIEAECRDGECERVTFTNQPAFMVYEGERLDVPGIGEVTVDVAYGGAFFAILDAAEIGKEIVPEEAAELSRLGALVTEAAAARFPVEHPENPDINTVSFCDWVGAPRNGGDARNANIVMPGRVDRSACGTATCARMSVLHAQGRLALGEDFVNESITSTHFVGRIVEETKVGPYSAVVPTISGRAWVYATSELGHHPADPLATGHRLADNWGAAPAVSTPLA
jgi:proline racemase